MSHSAPRLFPSLSPAVRLLLFANLAVFALNALLFGALSDPGDGNGGFWFACSWSALWEGWGLGLLRLLTYQFTHSFRDPLHLLMNMLVLWFFGAMVEPRLSARGTLRLYLAAGCAGAVLHLAIAALQGAADVPLVGASGACYGILLYAACQAPQATVILFVVPVRLWALAALLVGLGAYSTFVELVTGYAGGVSHGAHLGGALLGFGAYRFGWFTDLRPGPGLLADWRARWQGRRRASALREAAVREQQLDQILAKVKQHGLPALSAAERRFLEAASAAAGRRGR